jgi:hypothetical protein
LKLFKIYLQVAIIGTSLLSSFSYAFAGNDYLASSLIVVFSWFITPVGFLLIGFVNSAEKVLTLKIIKVVLFASLVTVIWFIPTAMLVFYSHIWGGGNL